MIFKRRKTMLTPEEKSDIEKKVNELLGERANSNSPNLDIIRFATDKGFVVQSLNMGDDITGMLLYDRDNKIVGTNSHKLIVVKRGLSEEQSRFVVAHELAHFCLNNGSNHQIAHREVETINNKDEEKAEYFSRCILMPKDFVKKLIRALKDYDSNISDEKLIRSISAIFSVTYAKAQVRYNEISCEN